MVFPTIETARLKLLPAENGRDLPTYMSHLDSSGEFFIQYGYHDSPELREAIELQCAEDIIRYSMFAKDTGEMVGYVGITPYENESMSGNLEFHVFQEFRRQRYAMEAVTAFLDAFFTGSLTTIAGETVVAETMKENEPSWRLLEALGFTRTSTGMCISLSEDGELNHDGCYTESVYELSRNDWKRTR